MAAGAYPWNVCPIVSQADGQDAGYSFAVGPRGQIELPAGDDSPVFNPAFLIENWGPADAAVTLNGQPLPPGPACRIGHRHHLDRSDLILWLQHESTVPLKIRIAPA